MFRVSGLGLLGSAVLGSGVGLRVSAFRISGLTAGSRNF